MRMMAMSGTERIMPGTPHSTDQKAVIACACECVCVFVCERCAYMVREGDGGVSSVEEAWHVCRSVEGCVRFTPPYFHAWCACWGGVRTEGEDDDDGVHLQVLPKEARLLPFYKCRRSVNGKSSNQQPGQEKRGPIVQQTTKDEAIKRLKKKLCCVSDARTHQVVPHEEVPQGREHEGEDFGGGGQVWGEEDERQGEEGRDDGAELFV